MSPISSSRSLDEAPRAASAKGVGAALGQIIALAEAEADQVRAEAREHAAAILAAAHDAAETTRSETDRYVVARRIAVGREADGVIEKATGLADEIIARAEGDADARSRDARLAYDRVRADLDDLAARRDEIERLLHERTVLLERRTAAARHEANRLRGIQNAIRAAQMSDRPVRPINDRTAVAATSEPSEPTALRSRLLDELEQATARRDAVFDHLAELGRMLTSLGARAEPRRPVHEQARRARMARRSAAAPAYHRMLAGRRPGPARGRVG